MENLYIERTTSTPEIYFNKNKNVLKIEGQSYPENAFDFYQPIIEWIEKFFENLNGRAVFEFTFQYLNTSSTKCIMNIIDILEDAYDSGKEPIINWYYDENNRDMIDIAEEFKEDIKFNFNIMPIHKKFDIPLEFKTENETLSNIEYAKKKYSVSNKDSDLFSEYLKLGKSYKKLLRQIVKLTHISDKQQEHLIKAKKDLEDTTASLRTLLDHAGQGFLSFDSDMIINKNYSLECEKIFNCSPAGRNFVDLAFENDVDEKITIHKSLINILKSLEENNKLNINVYISLLPEVTLINDKHIRLEYKVLEQPKKIMVILTDISEKIEFEKKVKEEERILRVTVNIIANQSIVKELFQAYKNFFEKNNNKTSFSKDELQEFYRSIHTFKGSFAQHYLNFTSRALHNLENSLKYYIYNFDNIIMEDVIHTIKSFPYIEKFKEDLVEIEEILGENYFNLEDSTRPVLIDKIEVEKIKDTIKPNMSEKELLNLKEKLERLTYVSLKESLKFFSNYIYSQAEYFEREIGEFSITGTDIKLDLKKYQPIIDTLGHIFRNSIIHGIEPTYERITKNKNPKGRILCNLNHTKENIEISIKDDGRGIDTESIIETLLKHNLFSIEEIENMSQEEIVNCIFLENFSTSQQVTDISGRGVGLTEIQKKVEEFGGSIDIVTKKDEGTEFKIILPFV